MIVRKEMNVPNSAHDFSRETDHSDILQGEYGISTDILATFRVDNCIVLAAHNERANQGMLGHFSSISPTARANPELANEQFDTDTFMASVESLDDLGPTAQTSLWLGGAALHPWSSLMTKASIRHDRRFAERQIHTVAAQIGIVVSNIMVDWNTSLHDLNVWLDCPSGLLVVEQTEDDPDL
jgi:hypothetical protein